MGSAASAEGQEENTRLVPLKCQDGSRPKILLAEDSPAARVLTGALLNRIGCNVDAAEHGEEALSYIKNQTYDLVLMDIEMPVMDGVAAAQEIRTMGGETAKTPIVALSAFLADTKKSTFWQQHFDHALSKPTGKRQLHATISQVLNIGSREAQVFGDAPGEVDQPVELVEEGKLERIFNNICEEDRNLLLRTASQEIRRLSDNLQDGFGAGDHDDVAQTLHKISGLSATFAATSLYEMTMAMRREKQSMSANAESGDADRERVLAICDCASHTAEALRSKVADQAENTAKLQTSEGEV